MRSTWEKLPMVENCRLEGKIDQPLCLLLSHKKGATEHSDAWISMGTKDSASFLGRLSSKESHPFLKKTKKGANGQRERGRSSGDRATTKPPTHHSDRFRKAPKGSAPLLSKQPVGATNFFLE